ncbi:MAG TPA: hypothetical protein VFQ77_17685 [Pseudonocardiaceae bacterium]|nr:hypothetical protein [Pseudonocardiaceae bacterium]
MLLNLGNRVSALVLPTTLAEQTRQILAARTRPAPVWRLRMRRSSRS